MTVLVSTAYIDEAENFENVVVMDDGKIICHENTREFIKRENCSNLEDAYMKALPPGKRGKEGGFHIPPYEDVPGEEPELHRGERRELPHQEGRDIRVPRIKRLRQVNHDEDADGPP